MNSLKLRFTFSSFALLIILCSCNSQTQKGDFIAQYRIDRNIPVDTTLQTLMKIKQASNWTISLEENDNFELSGSDKNVVGYWNIEKISDKGY